MAEDPIPTDPADELLDLLDAWGAPLARGKARAEVHRDGDWHRAFHLWVARPERCVLLQRRSKRKDFEGGKVDVSVAGHYRFGETLLDVLREAEEEIGLILRPGEVTYLTTLTSERTYADAVDREYQEVYVVSDDRDLAEYRTDCVEVDVLYDAPLDPLIDLYRNAIRSLPVGGYDCQARVNNALLIDSDLIEQAREETANSLEFVREWLEDEGAAPTGTAP